MEFGVDWTGPCGHRQLGVVIPEVQLQRSLTDQEVGSLPDPDGPSVQCVRCLRTKCELIIRNAPVNPYCSGSDKEGCIMV